MTVAVLDLLRRCHRGRDVVFVEGRLEDAEGRVLATATAATRVIPFAPRAEP